MNNESTISVKMGYVERDISNISDRVSYLEHIKDGHRADITMAVKASEKRILFIVKTVFYSFWVLGSVVGFLISYKDYFF